MLKPALAAGYFTNSLEPALAAGLSHYYPDIASPSPTYSRSQLINYFRNVQQKPLRLTDSQREIRFSKNYDRSLCCLKADEQPNNPQRHKSLEITCVKYDMLELRGGGSGSRQRITFKRARARKPQNQNKKAPHQDPMQDFLIQMGNS